jgi:hypothetical protein
MMILKFWKQENLWQGPLASGPRRLVTTCLSQRAPTHAPTRAWRHRGGSITAHHLSSALTIAHHLCSTCSPCNHRLHVRAAPLSRVAATSKPRSTPLPRQPPSSHPTLLSSPFASVTAAHIADHASHRYCRRPRAPELRRHAALPSAREAVSLHDRATNCTGCLVLRVELIVDSRLRPTSGQATNSPSSARVPCSSPTGEPTTTATVPTCRQSPSPL